MHERIPAQPENVGATKTAQSKHRRLVPDTGRNRFRKLRNPNGGLDNMNGISLFQI